MENSINELAERYGILGSYINAFGSEVRTSREAKILVLKAMGLDLSSLKAVEFELQKSAKYKLPNIAILENSHFSLELPGDSVHWKIFKGRESILQGDSRKVDRIFNFNFNLPIGYYELELSNLEHKLLLVSVPPRAYVPEILADKKHWGLTAQLYALGKNSNKSFGDFAALKELKEFAKYCGASFIGLNPLLATGFPNKMGISPYSPISRHALNEIYIQTELPESQDNLIDYQAIADYKYNILWQRFLQNQDRSYKSSTSTELQNYALYSALRAEYGSCWSAWPEAYRNINSKEVLAFKESNKVKIDFYLYLQSLARDELFAFTSKDILSDSILYLDFPVGVALDSSDVWADPNLYALAASAGAPPDELAPQGQSWGLPPFIPESLFGQAFQPFIQALKFSMQFAGAIRIDHVMSLWRLYWQVENGEGAYVKYPARELTSIVKLESHLNQCLVIGEDLGTVPAETQYFMSTSGVFSYKVFYFEKDAHDFKAPETYQKESLCCVGTHDLAPLRGFLEKTDLSERRNLNLHSEQVLQRLENQRDHDLEALKRFLEIPELEFNIVLEKLYPKLLKSNSMLLAVQLEDLIGQLSQVNLPGTVEQRPNWRQVLELDSYEEIKTILKRIFAVN